jgi:hypothetical protein
MATKYDVVGIWPGLKKSILNSAIFGGFGTGRVYVVFGIAELHHLGDKSLPFYLIYTFTSDLILTSGGFISSLANFKYSESVDEVKQYFSGYSNIKITKG